MRVLVTGGAGFIGSHVVAALQAAGHESHVVDDLSSGRPENVAEGVPLYQVDIRDAGALEAVFEEVEPEVVDHHAAQVSVSRSVSEPDLDAQVNVQGTFNVIQAARRVGTRRIVFASSGGAIYGDTSGYVDRRADEQATAAPMSPYGVGKWMAELSLRETAEASELTCLALRYSNVYGPRQSTRGEAGVVAAFCRDLLAGTPPTIFGDGRQIRDFVYVDDVARANLLAVEATPGQSFMAVNISCGTAVDIGGLAEVLSVLVRERTGGDPIAAILEPPRAGDIRHSLLDPSLAVDLLGWSAAVGLREGLGHTLDWLAARSC